jgi:hypothetical protein
LKYEHGSQTKKNSRDSSHWATIQPIQIPWDSIHYWQVRVSLLYMSFFFQIYLVFRTAQTKLVEYLESSNVQLVKKSADLLCRVLPNDELSQLMKVDEKCFFYISSYKNLFLIYNIRFISRSLWTIWIHLIPIVLMLL